MANKVGLTDAKIAGLKAPTAGQIELADGIVPGLRLRMGASGIKTYILRKRVQGKCVNGGQILGQRGGVKAGHC